MPCGTGQIGILIWCTFFGLLDETKLLLVVDNRGTEAPESRNPTLIACAANAGNLIS